MSESIPPTPAASDGATSNDLLLRFAARLIDGVLLGIVQSFVVTGLIVGAIFGTGIGNGRGLGSGVLGSTAFSVASLVGSIIGAAIFIGYFAFLESSRGQTIGKMLVRLRVEGPGGGNPTLEQAIRRNAWLALSIVPWIGGLAQFAAAVYIAVTISQGRPWHDAFAGGTRVVKVA
ncbi:MAG: hypothetical protein RLZZ272_30 [Actinomycetota bacterium]|jgi:uncharacterized RDD family membrane protein YckC